MAEEPTTDPGPSAQAGRLPVAAASTDGVGVLTPAGELDLSSGDVLREAIAQAAAAQPRIVLDLHELTFMDSTGVNILIAAHQSLADAGGWLRLAAPTEPVLRTLQLVGVDTVIDCHTSLHDALTA